MALDPYQPCPCGSDKKVKFCCGADMVAELSKVQDLIQSEQRVAALDLIGRLLETHSDRGCLYMQKANVQMQLGEWKAAEASVDKLLECVPQSSVGRAQRAIIATAEGDLDQGEEWLQKALEVADGKISGTLYTAIGMIGVGWIQRGNALAGRGHLLFQNALMRGKDEQVLRQIIELDSSGNLPLPTLGLEYPSRVDANGRLSAAGIAEFNVATQKGSKGCWKAAAEALEAIAEREPYEPAVWKNIGLFRLWLGESDKARLALRRYASFGSVPRDEAIEIEAIAQYLLGPSIEETIPELTLTYEVNDASALKEHLLSTRTVQAVPFNAAEYSQYEEVPPLGIFHLLDKEVPATSEGLTHENAPRVLGDLYLFGKQTDRAARVEFELLATPDKDAKVAALEATIGSQLGKNVSEEETGRMTRLGAELMLNWRLPADTSVELRKKLISDRRDHVVLNVWPDLPLGALDGKSLRQAAGDHSLQTRALAAILMMDLAEPVEQTVYNTLRQNLALPLADAIESAPKSVTELSIVQLTRLDPSKLNDDDLELVFRRASFGSVRRLIKRVVPEVLKRPSLEKRIYPGDLFELLSRLATDSDEALEMIIKAQEYAVAHGQSPAGYLLGEIPLRLERREVQEFQRLFERLRTKHINEPGVAQALQQLLYQMGILKPDGSLVSPQRSEDPLVASASPSAGGSGLWTPDQGSQGAGSGGKSKLWVPGMD